jgi:hypothetical protein
MRPQRKRQLCLPLLLPVQQRISRLQYLRLHQHLHLHPKVEGRPEQKTTTPQDLAMTNSAIPSQFGDIQAPCPPSTVQVKYDCLATWAQRIHEGRDHPHLAPYQEIWGQTTHEDRARGRAHDRAALQLVATIEVYRTGLRQKVV